jgi:hypothetical protein
MHADRAECHLPVSGFERAKEMALNIGGLFRMALW